MSATAVQRSAPGAWASDACITVQPAWRAVRIDETNRLHVPAGVSLDLTHAAAAIALDIAAERAAARTGEGVLIGCRDNIVAAGEPPSGGWIVGMAGWADGSAGAEQPHVTLHVGGMSTALAISPCWPAEAHAYAISDAQQRWRVVTVIGASCVESRQLADWGAVSGSAVGALAAGTPFRAVRADGRIVLGNGWPN